MKMINYLEKIYDMIYDGRLRLLKALEEKSVHSSNHSNVLVDWGIISIINGYYIYELNTMTIRQIMHLRKKPDMVIYSDNYDTLSRCIALSWNLTKQYQPIQMYKLNIIQNSDLRNWLAGGRIQWFHRFGVYIGLDNTPMITQNSGATWNMVDLSEIYSYISDIRSIKATISSEFEIIFFTILTESSIRIFALSAKSFEKLDHTWLIEADLNMFDDFKLSYIGNSDTAELISLNGGKTLILQVYGKWKNELTNSMHHFIASVNSSGTITKWEETKDYFSSFKNSEGQFIITKSYKNNYGVEAVRSTYCEFILVGERLHMILTTGTTKQLSITKTFFYDKELYGQLTTESGMSSTIYWVRTTLGLIIILNNRYLSFYENFDSFTLITANTGIGLRRNNLYLYQNGDFDTSPLLITGLNRILRMKSYSGARQIALLDNIKGECVVSFSSTFEIDSIRFLRAITPAQYTISREHSISNFCRTNISTNGDGICVRSYSATNDAFNGYEISYDCGLHWHLRNSKVEGKNRPGILFIYGIWCIIGLDGRIRYANTVADLEMGNLQTGALLRSFSTNFERICLYIKGKNLVPTLSSYIDGDKAIIAFRLINKEYEKNYIDECVGVPLAKYEITKDELIDKSVSVTYQSSYIVESKWANNQSKYSYEYDEKRVNLLENTKYLGGYLLSKKHICGIYINPIHYGFIDKDYAKIRPFYLAEFLPPVQKLQSGIILLNQNDLEFQTLANHRLKSKITKVYHESESLVSTYDSGVLLETDFSASIIDDTHIVPYHQGISQYIDIQTGKITRYSGRIEHIQSLHEEILDTEGVLLQIMTTNELLYGISKSAENECTLLRYGEDEKFHIITKLIGVVSKVYLIDNNRIIYQSNDDLIQLYLHQFDDSGNAMYDILVANNLYHNIREIFGFTIFLSITNSMLGIQIEKDQILTYPLINHIEDMIEWNYRIYAILDIMISGVSKVFLIPFEDIKDLTTSEYVIEESVVYPNEIIQDCYELDKANESEVINEHGESGVRLVSCGQFLLLWSKYTNFIYKYDGILLTYWNQAIGTSIVDVKFSNGVIYVRDSKNFLYYSYDGNGFDQYYISELSTDFDMETIKGSVVLCDRTANKLYRNGSILGIPYGYYIPRFFNSLENIDIEMYNSKIIDLFGMGKNFIIINGKKYELSTEIENTLTDTIESIDEEGLVISRHQFL